MDRELARPSKVKKEKMMKGHDRFYSRNQSKPVWSVLPSDMPILVATLLPLSFSLLLLSDLVERFPPAKLLFADVVFELLPLAIDGPLGEIEFVCPAI